MYSKPPQQDHTWRSPTRRVPKIALVGLTLAAMSVPAVIAASVASAAVPSFPDNLLVFPNRDFISVAGYAEHAGETALVKVNRPGVGVIGSATSLVSGGDVAFEINHPGGVCWGNGTSVKVTPDILPGDTATISFGGTDAGDTTVQDAFAIEPPVYTAGSDTYVVTGHIGAGVDQTMVEQRTVNPDLTATTVGKRDIRAIPGPLTAAPRGGYSSSLDFTGNTFTATYVFDDPANAKIAASGGGERLLSWQVVDLAGNRQGVTIAEADMLGGPGMGGCPNGATQAGPVGPSDVLAANVTGGVKLTWTPAVAVPGTAAITGYRATAVAQTIDLKGEQVEVGRRITGQAATGTTITGLSTTESYDVEVVSVSSVGETFPAVHAIPVTDTTKPTVSATPVGGSYALAQSVALSANEAGSEIYYTTDGTTDPVQGDSLAPGAVLYTAKIPITADTTLKYAAFDPSGNVSLIGQQDYVITNKPTPDAPTFGAATVGQGSITLNWSSTDTSITGYRVQLYDAAGLLPVGAFQDTPGTSLTITGLTAGTTYSATVQAKNANGYGPESAKLGSLVPQGAVVANAGPDQTVVRKTTATTVTLTGAGSTPAATYSWTQVLSGATDPDKVTMAGTSTLNPTFTLPLYKFPMTNKALTFRLTVTKGPDSTTADVKVTPQPDQVAIGTAKWKLGDFRVTGTSTVVGASITLHKGSLSGASLGTFPVTAAAPPATGGVFDARIRSTVAPFNTNPGTIWIESSVGGTAGPFTVS